MLIFAAISNAAFGQYLSFNVSKCITKRNNLTSQAEWEIKKSDGNQKVCHPSDYKISLWLLAHRHSHYKTSISLSLRVTAKTANDD